MANVSAVLPGMNAEYMGAKMMGIVGEEHVPASRLTAPASVGALATAGAPASALVGAAPPAPLSVSLGVLMMPPSFSAFAALFDPPPEQATATAAIPAADIPSARTTPLPPDRVFMWPPIHFGKEQDSR